MNIVTPIITSPTNGTALRDGAGDLLGFIESCAIADEVVRRVNAHDALVAALEAAQQVAFDGPREEKGAPGGESYNAWKHRVEDEVRAALLAARSP